MTITLNDARESRLQGSAGAHGASPAKKSSVAELSALEIGRMSRTEMIAAAGAAPLPLGEAQAARLEFLDRPTLERLVYLARKSCRNQGF